MAEQIAYLGPKGTYCSQAVEKYLRRQGKKIEAIPLNTITEVIHSVNTCKYKYGIVPMENTIEGSVSATLDKLANKRNSLYIISEIDISVKHQLLALPNARLGEIKEVISHTQALEQCRDFLFAKLPNAKIMLAKSTAQAVLKVKEKKQPCRAAVGSREAARKYGLKILIRDIADYKDNVTRFVVLSKEKEMIRDKDAITAFVFSCKKDRPGGLYEILGFLAKDKINMTKIESRPSKVVMGDYIFFIDIAGNHYIQPKVAQALRNIEKHSDYFKLLGVYQRKK
ncbi:MAG: prephenate dehydratase [Candidatus Margulisbacteria bacterium]|jgi:prephenate dehydratase|nr:prephenate dehydratase [Candidatus Margulisiibacteriota bacterium]